MIFEKKMQKNDVTSSFVTLENIIEVCKIGTFQRNLSTMLLKVLNIYLFQKYFRQFKL